MVGNAKPLFLQCEAVSIQVSSFTVQIVKSSCFRIFRVSDFRKLRFRCVGNSESENFMVSDDSIIFT